MALQFTVSAPSLPQGLSSLPLRVAPPPQQCLFTADPSVGDALLVQFTLSVQKCQTQAPPLRYRF